MRIPMGAMLDEIKFLTVDAGARKAGEYLDKLQVSITNLEAAINACCDESLRGQLQAELAQVRALGAEIKALRAEVTAYESPDVKALGAEVKALRAEVTALKQRLETNSPR